MSEQAQEATQQDAQAATAETTATETAARVETFDREYVEKLRKEAADYRTRATAAEAKVKATEEKDLSELELARKQAAEAAALAQQHEAALKSERLRGNIERTAAKLGFANLEIAARLVPQDAITYDDAGNATNVESLLAQILTDNPYLRGVVQSGATTNAATRNQAEPVRTDADIRAEMNGAGVRPFDHNRATRMGGGAMPLRPKENAV